MTCIMAGALLAAFCEGGLSLAGLQSFGLGQKNSDEQPKDESAKVVKEKLPLSDLEFSNSLPSESQSLIEQKIRETEEGIYEFIAEEFETDSIDKGLWLRLFSECGGDETQTKVLYIRQRFEKLAVIERARIKQEYYKEVEVFLQNEGIQ